jgi:hypothetical protein
MFFPLYRLVRDFGYSELDGSKFQIPIPKFFFQNLQSTTHPGSTRSDWELGPGEPAQKTELSTNTTMEKETPFLPPLGDEKLIGV